ncbi:MAG: hypothetical protein M1816_003831 [Peltula sp. TS41687]|nr:MAG: hypothetical protein M1816_003831 [Peltula sp. TS41687]
MSSSSSSSIIIADDAEAIDENPTRTPTNPNPSPNPTLIPILLLKTASTPSDAYADYFSQLRLPRPNSNGDENITFEPVINLPVLEHTFHEENIHAVEQLLLDGAFCSPSWTSPEDEDEYATTITTVASRESSGRRRRKQYYGGIIFTSQRAVEAFVEVVRRVAVVVVEEDKEADTVFYVVGPATHRALLSSPDIPAACVFGDETGNGERLAQFILTHYNALHTAPTTSNTSNSNSSNTSISNSRRTKPPLLFLAGETRRDIIPRTLMTSDSQRRIQVDELVVYETRLLRSFAGDLQKTLDALFEKENEKDGSQDRTRTRTVVWVVVFSPTGCRELLDVLGRLRDHRDEDGDGDGEEREGDGRQGERRRQQVKIVTIGPTTRAYLVEEFGFQPDGWARKPSPEGVAEVIENCMADGGSVRDDEDQDDRV